MAIEIQPASATNRTDHRYRVLLPLGREAYLPGLLYFAIALAQALDGEVLVLHVTIPGDKERDREWRLPEEDAAHLEPVPHEVRTVEADSVPSGILSVASESHCDLILLAWRGAPRAMRNKLGHILDPVVEGAPCDVALLKGERVFEPGAPRLERVLLATAGGPNAVPAARFAVALARFARGTLTLVTVIPEDAEAAEEENAHQMLDKIVQEIGLDDEEALSLVEREVVREGKVVSAVISAAKNHDVVFLGATGDSVVNQLVLGSVTERIARDLSVPVVVVRGYRGPTEYWLRRVWRQLDRVLPSLDREEQLDAYKRIRRGARATGDFYTLIFLSVVIATMGLLLNSAAVIIGAMLVAPLMTPVLALGLGVVLGDARLLRIAAQSTLWGVLLAIAVSAALAWAAPLALFTTEVESRTHPNLFDLTVALAAGAAGAFSVSRQNIRAALPGVAIAAALVPPLSVIGITAATERWSAAGGALLLFGTNLVAITLAASVVYLVLGFYPQAEEQERHTVLRRGFLVTLALVFFVTLPLARRLEQDVTNATLSRTLRSTLEDVMVKESDLSLASFDWETPPGQPIALRVVLYAGKEVTRDTLVTIDEAVTNAVGREVDVRLVVIPANELGGGEQPPP